MSNTIPKTKEELNKKIFELQASVNKLEALINTINMKSMKVKDIPSDELVITTPELYQEFCIGGCVPMCHQTLKPIMIGEKFKLARLDVAIRKGSMNYNKIESRDVMLSENADVEIFKKLQDDLIYQEKLRRKQGGGCFRVNGNIA